MTKLRLRRNRAKKTFPLEFQNMLSIKVKTKSKLKNKYFRCHNFCHVKKKKNDVNIFCNIKKKIEINFVDIILTQSWSKFVRSEKKIECFCL